MSHGIPWVAWIATIHAENPPTQARAIVLQWQAGGYDPVKCPGGFPDVDTVTRVLDALDGAPRVLVTSSERLDRAEMYASEAMREGLRQYVTGAPPGFHPHPDAVLAYSAYATKKPTRAQARAVEEQQRVERITARRTARARARTEARLTREPFTLWGCLNGILDGFGEATVELTHLLTGDHLR